MSKRPYKDAWTLDRAIALIRNESGLHFAPAIVKAFLNALDEIKVIMQKYYD